MTHQILLAALAIVVIGVTGPTRYSPGAALPSPESVRHIPELAWHAASAGPDCSVTCWDQHETNEHIAVDGGSTNERGGGAHFPTAFAGLCADKHPGCDIETNDENLASLTERIRGAVQAADLASLKTLLESSGGTVYIAAERSAVQIVGCRGDIVAHVRIPSDLSSLLTD